MAYTLTTAARACGINRTTVLRAIKSGKISATRNEHNEWEIAEAEMHRVYPMASNGADHVAPHQHALDIAADALVAELRSVITDLRQDRDAWKEIAQRLSLPSPLRPWWRRLAG